MAISREILLILVLLFVVVVLVKVVELFQHNVVEADASKFVMEDLANKYPGADLAISTITPKQNPAGEKYFEVKARVTQNAAGPCPARSHIFYNYPVQNFVPQLPEVITSNCKVCTETMCTIAFPEEAIIASHTLAGTEDVASYLASFTNVLSNVEEVGDSWVVTWDSQDVPYFYKVVIRRDGTITSVTMLAKPST